MKRQVTNEDIKKYMPMVNKYLRDSVVKNWNQATIRKDGDEISLGNTGWTMADIRQFLFCEVVVALQNYNPDYKTKEGNGVKESTFVYLHLYNRIGQLMKRITKRRAGYGIWSMSIDEVIGDNFKDE